MTKSARVVIIAVIVLSLLTIFSRLYNIEESLLFFIDMGRDANVLLDWVETSRPPLLGPQTSALPFNQSAWYFYILFPLFSLTQFSAFSAVYTNLLLYLGVFIGLLYACRSDARLVKMILIVWLLVIIHPQFVIQNRFVWNPSFVGPMVLMSVVSLLQLHKKWRWGWAISLAGSAAAAVSFNYSAAPFFIALVIMCMWLFKKRSVFIVGLMAGALLFLNAGTVFFELRHHFPLTQMMLYQPKLAQTGASINFKFRDIFSYSLEGPTFPVNVIMAEVVALAIVWSWFAHRSVTFEPQKLEFKITTRLLILTLVLTIATPVTILSHYIFGVLTVLLCVVALLPKPWQIVVICLLCLSWLQPVRIASYIQPARRTVADMERCFAQVCAEQTQPLFVSVQAGFHPFHAAQEHHFFHRKMGCTVKQLDTQINEAEYMSVVVDDSEYEHGKTAYNELTQFGPSEVIKTFSCQPNLSVVMLKKLP